MNSYEAGYTMGYLVGQLLTVGIIVLVIYGIICLFKRIKK